MLGGQWQAVPSTTGLKVACRREVKAVLKLSEPIKATLQLLKAEPSAGTHGHCVLVFQVRSVLLHFAMVKHCCKFVEASRNIPSVSEQQVPSNNDVDM